MAYNKTLTRVTLVDKNGLRKPADVPDNWRTG